MQKKVGFLLLGSMLLGFVFLGPAGQGQADQTKPLVAPAQQYLNNTKNESSLPVLPVDPGKNDSYVSRGEFAVKLVSALELNLDGYRFFKAPEVKDFFDDVPLESPVAEAITILGYNGVLNTSERSFRPDDKISREQLAVMLANLLHQKSKAATGDVQIKPVINDLSLADKEAREDIKYAVGLNVMATNRNGNFKPKQAVTQQELTMILGNLESLIKTDHSEVSARVITNGEGGREVELSWGEKPSSGYEITIVEFTLDGDTVVVTYQTQEPAAGSYNSTVITEPKDSHPIPLNYPSNLKLELKKL